MKLLIMVLALWGCGGDEPEDDPGPPPAHPFGEHARPYAAGTIQPGVGAAELDRATAELYDQWKDRYLVSGCGDQRAYVFVNADGTEGGGRSEESISISEGHGYGMMITAFMAGHDPEAHWLFDDMYRFFRDHPSVNSPDLMGWNQVEGCGPAIEEAGDDSATDGDLDVAHALLLADAQWGSDGDIDYRAEATAVVAAILEHEVHPAASLPQLGDWVDTDEPALYDGTRPSDLMVDHFRAFEAVGDGARWQEVLDASYALLAAVQDPTTGLVPDFVVDVATAPAPAPPDYLEGPGDGAYDYNACRVPLRVGTDVALNGDERGRAFLSRLIGWVETETGGDPATFVDGYALDGTPRGTDATTVFIAPLAVGAMSDASHQAFLDAAWGYLADRSQDDEQYYGNSLRVLAAIVLSGNAWSPAQ